MDYYPGIRSEDLRGYYAKRPLDLFLCILVLPFFILLILLVSVAIFIDTGGKVFFVQERVGKDNHLFKLIKFRTMYQDRASEGQVEFMKNFVRGKVGDGRTGKVYKPFNNEDVTRVGKFLRKKSLDELPQIVNVILGDMSIVGPRPNVPWEVEEYKDWHKRRLAVLPGITGLAQIRGRSGIKFDEIVQHDLEYIDNWSLWLDLRILLTTVASVLFQKGVI